MSGTSLLGRRRGGTGAGEGREGTSFPRLLHPRPMTPTFLSFRWSSDASTAKPRRASMQDEHFTTVDDDERGRPIWTSHGYGVIDRDPFTGPLSSSPSSRETRSRPSTASAPPGVPTKPRGSIFMAASDALGFKFGRRKPPIRQPPSPVILPDVIEITARKRDEEMEERNRLRAEAAQAIGLDPLLVESDAQSRHDTTDEDETGDSIQRDLDTVGSMADPQYPNVLRNSGAGAPPVHGSSTSVAASYSTRPVGRLRSGSLATHSRTNSANLTPIPTYPSTITALTHFQQHSGTLPKYYHPSSLRIFALSNSRNWKERFIILTSPTAIVTRSRGPASSYLHLFKASGPEEKELERLEINEDSVVFVSDDEVGGRRHVVKVGGVEVGAFKRELNYEESGRTMWFLQIEDSAESRQWISSIKNSILNQRAIRAGLLPATSFGVNEPRGDMDVMLSMRAQGFITSPTNSTARQHHSTPPSTVVQAEKNYASSVSSHSVHSQASSPKAPTSIAVSTLKGLFSGSRPRSASRATNADTSKPQHDGNEDTFSNMGNNLMSMLRSNTPDVQSQSSGATVVRANSPLMPPITPDVGIDRKILTDRQPLQLVTNDSSSATAKNRGTKSLSLGSMSLQPPPRKRWTTSSVTPVDNPTQPPPEVYQNVQYSGTTGSLGAITYYKDQQPPSSPTHTNGSTNDASDRPRAASLQSVSTSGSNENSMSLDTLSISTKRSSAPRHWSRQGPLPPRLTPPLGPLPNAPGSSARSHVTAGDNRPASSASSRSGQSQQSVVSSLPSFSKRASVSSVGTSSTSHSAGPSHPVARPVNTYRASMPPPPRPAPTSALPPAPGERNRPKSSDSFSNPVPPKTKRASIAGRGFRLSLAAPKPPPSTTLPPRPDEVEYKQAQSRTISSGNNRLSRLKPIPASPDPVATLSTPPFPPPRGPLPPTPAGGSPEDSGSSQANGRPSTGVLRHTSLKQRLRLLSAPSSPPTNTTDTSVHTDTPASGASNTPHVQTHTRSNSSSFASRFSNSHHTRSSSTSHTPLTNPLASPANNNNTNDTNTHTNNKATIPPLLTSSPYFGTGSQPSTPIGEKITLFQNEQSFLQFTTPITPHAPLPSIRPLPAIPASQEMTSLSPPPRRNSKHLIVVDLPRTPSPRVATTQEETDRVAGPLLTPSDTQPLPLSLPPSPVLRPPGEEDKLNTPPESPESETHRTSSRPVSVISFGVMRV